MASTRTQKSIALQEVEREWQKLEYLYKLIEQTGLENQVSQDLHARRKSKKAEKIPAAIPGTMIPNLEHILQFE